MKNTQFRFRCKTNPAVIYVPEYMFDVDGMRRHPEYEEIDADGNVMVPFEQKVGVQRMSLTLKRKK